MMDESLSSLFAKADSLRRQIDDGTVEDTQVQILKWRTKSIDKPSGMHYDVRAMRTTRRAARSVQ